MNKTNSWDRLMAAAKGEPVDRVPMALWRHWPGVDASAETFIEATVDYQHKWDFDMVKLVPSGLSAVADWGVRMGAPYSAHGEPTITRWGITGLKDWDRLEPLDPAEGRLAQEVGALRAISRRLSRSVPIVQTFFAPLTNAGKIAGERLMADLREHPRTIHRALRVITDTTISYMKACLVTGGADGVFISSKYAGNGLCTEDEYMEFGAPYDLEVLECVRNLAKIRILHLHGDLVVHSIFAKYPVDFVNWHDRGGGPSIREALSMYRCGLMAGIANANGFVRSAEPRHLCEQAREAVAQAEGRRLVVAPGCVMPLCTTDEQYSAIRAAVRE